MLVPTKWCYGTWTKTQKSGRISRGRCLRIKCIRWLDIYDTWLSTEWGQSSYNFGGILAVAYYLSRNNQAEGKPPLSVRDVLVHGEAERNDMVQYFAELLDGFDVTVAQLSLGGMTLLEQDYLLEQAIERFEVVPDLVLLDLPDDLLAAIDQKLPPRWSRNNPIDCAGGETRDTIPEVMELVATHPAVHSIIYLGLGIQSNQAQMMRHGTFYPDHGLERIVEYHERQDTRFAEAAHELSVQTGKPILASTELAIADPTNAGPVAVRASGRLCYPSGERAVSALGHMYRRVKYQQARSS